MGYGDELEVNSGAYTPQSMILRRKMAEAMMKQGLDISPIQSPWQGVSRVLQAMMGGKDLGDLERKEAGAYDKAGKSTANLYETGLGLGSGSVSSSPSTDARPTEGLDMKQPRSARTNNPGAIEYGPFAKAMGATGSDGRYAVFPDADTGYKAQEKLLSIYQRRGQNTVESIIGGTPDNPDRAWAPRNVDRNSTDAYIAHVSKKLGIRPGDPIPPERLSDLADAMADYEAGPGRALPRGGAQVAVAPPTRVAQIAPPDGTMVDAPTLPAGATPMPAAPQPVMPAPSAVPPAGAIAAPPPAATAGMPQLPIGSTPTLSPQQQAEGRAAIEVLNSPGSSPAARQQAQAILMDLRKRVEPLSPKDQAELAYKESQTRENAAQIPMHSAKARESAANAAEKENEVAKMRTPAQTERGVHSVLGELKALPEKYGTQAFERGTGEFIGAAPVHIYEDPITSIGRGAARVAGRWQAASEGGAQPSQIQDEIGGYEKEMVSYLKPYLRVKGEGSQDQREFQAIVDQVGNLRAATSVRDYNQRLDAINRRVARFTNGEAKPIEAVPVEREARPTAEYAREHAEDERARLAEELKRRTQSPQDINAFFNKILGGL